MKIAMIMCPFGAMPPDGVGAVEKLFHLLAGEWVKSGNEVCFVCAGGGDNPGIEYRRLKRYNRTGSTKKDLVWDLLFSIKALFACPKCDVLFCNTFWSPAFAPLFRWKYKKLVYGVHRFPKRQFFLYPFVDKFICVSTVVANALKKQVAADKVSVIVNPIDVSVFNPSRRDAAAVVDGRVAFAGRVHPLKGIMCLARACARLHEEGLVKELLLIGPWESEKGGGGPEFVEQVKGAAKCPVTLAGGISDPARLAELESTAAVFVYPSEDIDGEAFGIAPLEAMALGVPTIVSSLSCFDEFVDDGMNAVKFKLGDVDSLCQCLRSLLSDSAVVNRLADAANKTFDYSVEKVAAKYRLNLKLLKDRSR